jgi:sulfate transport system permease protein
MHEAPRLLPVRTDPPVVRGILIGVALGIVVLFLVAPLLVVFTEALREGWQRYFAAIREPEALVALRLTLLITGVVVPLNAAFGLAAAWAIGRFQFRGKGLVTALIDLPFTVSPVIGGIVFVLLFGRAGWFGPWLQEHGIRILFAPPGMILATAFVTFPFVARELIPLLEAQGREEEEAAVVLGASGWQVFRRVTLPAIRWGLLYGLVMCTARAMGEFGAVSVVSGHIRGQTNTLTLYVELLYNSYRTASAFAVASLLTLLSLLTLVAKHVLEIRGLRRLAP